MQFHTGIYRHHCCHFTGLFCRLEVLLSGLKRLYTQISIQVLYLRDPWDNNSCRDTCSPDNVAEFAGTMDSTAVAEQQSQSLSSETDWPRITERISKHLCN